MQVFSVLGGMAVPLPQSLAVFLALPLLVGAVHTGHGAAASIEGDDLLEAIQRRGDLPEMVRPGARVSLLSVCLHEHPVHENPAAQEPGVLLERLHASSSLSLIVRDALLNLGFLSLGSLLSLSSRGEAAAAELGTASGSLSSWSSVGPCRWQQASLRS